MARSVTNAARTALQAGRAVARDFLWIVPKRRDTGALVPTGFWSDRGPADLAVVNPDTGLSEVRSWQGSGQLIQIGGVALTSDLTAQDVKISMSKVDANVIQLVRDYDARFAKVEIYRGLFDPASRLLIEPASCRFVGEVDTVDVPTSDEETSITLTCRSHAEQLTRFNSAKSSHENQILRDATDDFLADKTTVGEWTLFWGKENGKLKSKTREGFSL